MKKYFTIIFFVMSAVANAQRGNSAAQLSHYIFDSFSKGRVLVKSGIMSEQTLNYNVLTGEMIYNDAGRLLAIGNPKDVDSIFIGERKFIPVNDKFYEILADTKLPLLQEFSYKIEEPTVSVGYGNASPTTNTTSLSSLVTTGAVYDLALPADFKVIPVNNYWIKNGEKYEKANTAQQLMKVFPGKKDMIKKLIKANNTSFSKRADVIRLVQDIQ